MNETILIVDDDPHIMRIMLQVLQASGYQVIPAYGAEDALRKVARHKIDLILTDLAMPKVSGVELIQEVKRNPDTKHIPVIAITAYMWERMAQTAGDVGCDAYLSKPFKNRELLAIVQKHLKQTS